MTARAIGGRDARRSPLACLLVALVIALGLGGGAPAGLGGGDRHPVVAAASGGQGPQAVLDLHTQPRLGEHRSSGATAALLSALVIALALGLLRGPAPARTALPAVGRPACGSRAPPASVLAPA